MTGHLSKDSPDLVFPVSYHFCLGPASHLNMFSLIQKICDNCLLCHVYLTLTPSFSLVVNTLLLARIVYPIISQAIPLSSNIPSTDYRVLKESFYGMRLKASWKIAIWSYISMTKNIVTYMTNIDAKLFHAYIINMACLNMLSTSK